MKFEDFKEVDTLYQYLQSFKPIVLRATNNRKKITSEEIMCYLTIDSLEGIEPIYKLKNKNESIIIIFPVQDNKLPYIYTKKKDSLIQIETGIIENFSFESSEIV